MPQAVGSHALTITLAVVALAAAAGGLVLWVAILWLVAAGLHAYLPIAATLFALAMLHFGVGGWLAARLEHRQASPAGPTALAAPTPGAADTAPSDAPSEVEPPPGHLPRRRWPGGQRASAEQVAPPYRRLLAGVALGLLLARAWRR